MQEAAGASGLPSGNSPPLAKERLDVAYLPCDSLRSARPRCWRLRRQQRALPAADCLFQRRPDQLRTCGHRLHRVESGGPPQANPQRIRARNAASSAADVARHAERHLAAKPRFLSVEYRLHREPPQRPSALAPIAEEILLYPIEKL